MSPIWFTCSVRVSARSDYAVRAITVLAAVGEAERTTRAVKAEEIAAAQGIPLKFLLEILRELRNDGIVRSHRGSVGGYSLARPATEITVADVLRALDGPLVTVHETSLGELSYPAPANELVDVWMAMRTALRSVFDEVTVDQLARGALPAGVRRMAAEYRKSTERS